MLILLLNLIMGMMSATISNPEELEMPSCDTEYIQVRQLDLSRNRILREIINTVIQKDSSVNTCYYSVNITSCKNQYIVRVTAQITRLLFYSENGSRYYGYSVASNNIPIIFSIIGNYKLKYKIPKSEKTFEMRGKSYPPYPYDPDYWYFLISGDGYDEIDDWTAFMIYRDTYKENEKKQLQKDSTVSQ